MACARFSICLSFRKVCGKLLTQNGKAIKLYDKETGLTRVLARFHFVGEVCEECF